MVPSDILNGKYPEHAGQLATILHSVDALETSIPAYDYGDR